MTQLKMEKVGLDDIPEVVMSDGYELRTFRDGDEPGLARIYANAKLEKDTAEIVRADILGDPCFTPERVFVVTHNGMIVGSGSAWIAPDEPDAGYLHMLGVLNEHRGHRIGAALTCAALRYTRSEGFNIQRLMTDDWREEAIALYLKLGYDPLIVHQSHPMRWEAIGRRLNMPDITSRIRGEAPKPQKRTSFVTRLRRYVTSAILTFR